MSRIKGLNDRKTLDKKPPVAAIKVWKGEKKGAKSAGKNLNEFLRIEAPPHIRKAICYSYSEATEKNGSVYLKRLNITPAFEDKYQAFDSKMTAYTASRPVLFCDRETVHTEFTQKTDPFGNIYFQPKASDRPCPVAGTNFECPNKCSRTGDFYFYIFELVLDGYSEICRLQVHGVKDNQNIANTLDDIEEAVGSIKTSPFVSEETRTYIVYKLERVLSSYKFPVKENGVRTAKRGTKDDWILNLTLNPIWLNRYQYYQQAQQVKALNYQPSIKLIQQVHGDLIEPAPTQSKLLPPSLEEFEQQLAIAYRQNKWDKESWESMMQATFKTTEVSNAINLELLLAIASSLEERDRWGEF